VACACGRDGKHYRRRKQDARLQRRRAGTHFDSCISRWLLTTANLFRLLPSLLPWTIICSSTVDNTPPNPRPSFRTIFPRLTNERILPLLTKSSGFPGTGTRRPPQERYFECYCSVCGLPSAFSSIQVWFHELRGPHIKSSPVKIVAVHPNGKWNSEPFHRHERPFSFSQWPCLRFRATLHLWSSSPISRSFGWTTLGRTGDFERLAKSPPATLGRRDFGRLAGSTTRYPEHPSVWLGDYQGTTRSWTRLSKVKRSRC